MDWNKVITPLGEGAEKVHVAAVEAKKADDLTLKRDLQLLADEAMDLYQEASALKIRAELERG